ncbi:hypothetical protein [Acrocarpospora catenulata]|uniref:hypothetical protein n=1 Tax=Acrocarpospora catenulata TaxID=2836182 RepID=UPI003FD848E7
MTSHAHAQRRAAQLIRQQCDPTYEPDPPFEEGKRSWRNLWLRWGSRSGARSLRWPASSWRGRRCSPWRGTLVAMSSNGCVHPI